MLKSRSKSSLQHHSRRQSRRATTNQKHCRTMSTAPTPKEQKATEKRDLFKKSRAFDDNKLLSFKGEYEGSLDDVTKPFKYNAVGLQYHVVPLDTIPDIHEYTAAQAPKPPANKKGEVDPTLIANVEFITQGQFKHKKFQCELINQHVNFLKATKFAGKDEQIVVVMDPKTQQPTVFVGLGDVIDGVSTSAEDHVSLAGYGQAIHAVTKHIKDTLNIPNINVIVPTLHFSRKMKAQHGAGNGIVEVKDGDKADDDDEKDDEKDDGKEPVANVAPANKDDVVDLDSIVAQTIRYASAANHISDKYFSPELSKEKNFPLQSLFVTTPKSIQQSYRKVYNAINLVESEILGRELGNERSNIADNAYMEAKCQQLANAHSDVLSLKVYTEAELTAMGHNLIVAVGLASHKNPPRIAVFEYTPPNCKSEQKPIGLIGKTLTFDVGGLCLKSPAHMLDMSFDKLGGTTTLSIMRTLALNKPELNRKVVGALAIAENAIGSKALHPNGIVMEHGKSVQITDNDAEGRMALASALRLVQDRHNVNEMITMATLTGSVMVALGTHAAGIFTNNPREANKLIATGLNNDELYWQLPIFPAHHKNIKGSITDLQNCTTGHYSDASNAAAFLESFINKGNSLLHLDIAGVASLDDEEGSTPAGATGFGVTSVYDYVVSGNKQ